jgi:HAD superfamily hydrolase (TIGR01509 family)
VAASEFRAIIFDIGRVLIRVDVNRAVAGLGSSLSMTPQEVWSAIEKNPSWHDWMAGRISPRDWYLQVTKRIGATLTFDQFTSAWNQALDPQPIQSDAFLQELSNNYHLALLSNTDPIHMTYAETHYPFFQFFPKRIYSFQVGATKPDPVIYREALKACKVKADEAIYIDDVPAYTEAAQRLGMTGIVFQSPEQLQSDLRNAGIQVG